MRWRFVLFAVVLSMTSAAYAEVSGIYVEYWYTGSPWNMWQPVQGTPSRIGGEPGYPSGQNITISNAGSRFYRIYAMDPDNTDIGVVTIQGSGTSPNLFIGSDGGEPGYPVPSPGFHPSSRLAEKGCRNLVAIQRTGTCSLSVQAWVGEITGLDANINPQPTVVDRVYRVDATTASGEININQPGASLGAAGGVWRLGTFTTTGKLHCVRGDFSQVYTTGDCEGEIVCERGSLLDMQVGTPTSDGNFTGTVSVHALSTESTSGSIDSMIVHGNIGSASANAAIHADNFIKTLTANAIWADITAEDTADAMDGNIWNFSVLTGDFNGSIRAGNLARSGGFGGACEVQGNWNASVTLGGRISAPIIVHGSITPGSTWDDEVTIGTTSPVVLGPGETGDNEAPYYGVLGSSIGGGAVGLVPFMFHAKESAPDHDAVITAVPTSITIEHYGPVAEGDDQNSEPPVRIYEASAAFPFCSGYTDHADVPLCYKKCPSGTVYYWTRKTGFDIDVSGRAITISNNTDSFRAGYAYQVIPNDLVCDIDGSPQVVYAQGWTGVDGSCSTDANFPLATKGYGFRIASGMDLNVNFEMDPGDLSAWLADPVDVNNDSIADAADFAAIAEAVANFGE